MRLPVCHNEDCTWCSQDDWTCNHPDNIEDGKCDGTKKGKHFEG